MVIGKVSTATPAKRTGIPNSATNTASALATVNALKVFTVTVRALASSVGTRALVLLNAQPATKRLFLVAPTR
jgi:hypothetical protein